MNVERSCKLVVRAMLATKSKEPKERHGAVEVQSEFASMKD